ncbi:MAG: hypothetical protein V3T72_23135, partial [Thermoanaerobaculia bacterium]
MSDLKSYRAMCRGWSKAREGSDPDAFVRYELAYDAGDPDEIQAALDDKFRLWQMDRRKNPMFVRFLGQHDELGAQLTDPGQRAELARRARRDEEAFQARSTAKVEDHLRRLHQNHDFLTESEFQRLAPRMAELGLAEDEFRRRLEIPIRPDATSSEGDGEGLSRVLMEKLEQALRMFDKASLYEFLELGGDCPQAELQEHAREVRAVWDARPRDDRHTFAQTILGMIDTYLLADGGEQRQLYDEALTSQHLSRLLDVDLNLYAASGQITYDEFHKLMQVGTAKGLAEDDVKRYVRERARQLGAHVELTPDPGGRTCPKCGTVNLPAARYCTNVDCRQQLLRECPACETTQPVRAQVCANCGNPLGDPEELKAFQKVRGELEDGRLENATELLQRFRTQYPRSAFGVKDLQAEIAAARARRDADHKEIERSLELGDLPQAETKQRQLEQDFEKDRGVPDWLRKLGDRLRTQGGKIREELRQARELHQSGKLAEARERYQSLAEKWPKNDEVRKAREECPLPRAEGEVETRCLGPAVEIHWQEDNGSVRLERETLLGPRTGSRKVLADSDDSSYRDEDVEPGEAVRYLLRLCDPWKVSAEVIASEPLIIWEPLTGIEAVATGDGEITISWSGAAGAQKIEIVRAGVALAAEASPVVDTGLENGKTYDYSVRALYRAPDEEQLCAATSESIRATSVPPPEPPGTPAISYQKQNKGDSSITVVVSAAAPERGDLAFYRSPQEPPWQPGERLSPAEPLGTPLPRLPHSSDRIAAVDRQPAYGATYYLPVAVDGAYRVTGSARVGMWTGKIRNLRRRRDTPEDVVKLQWDWPEGCSHVMILSHPDDFPAGQDQPKTTKYEISQGDYLLHEGFELPHQSSDLVYLRLLGG